MLTIRLARSGAKKRPFFHITVADSRKPRDGRFIEKVGYFNPISKGKEIRLEVNQERLNYWLSEGAQPSKRVLSLLKENNETSEDKIRREEKKEKKRLRRIAKREVIKATESTKEAGGLSQPAKEEVQEKDDKVEETNSRSETSEKPKD